MSQYINIGKIVAPHGLTGHIIIEHALGKRIHFKGIEAIFIEKNTASFIPYFIQFSSFFKMSKINKVLNYLNVTALSMIHQIYLQVII